MIELPEAVTLARQMGNELIGRRIEGVAIAEDRPKFMFLNEDLGSYESRLVGRRIETVVASGKWIPSTLDSGDILLFGELFGRLSFIPSGADLPRKAHAVVALEGGGRVVMTVQAWGGFLALTPQGYAEHPYAGSQGISPLDDRFTLERFDEILAGSGDWSRKPIKAFLVHEGNVCGIGNGYLQDILFRAKLSPKRKVPDLGCAERKRLHSAIVATVFEAIENGGRDTEVDLYGDPGGYVPILDRRSKDRPCPECGTPIERISYLGGSCYVCPSCQPAP